MVNEPSGRIFSNALQFYRLAEPYFEDLNFLKNNVMAIICNLTLCVELLLKSTNAGVNKSPYLPNGTIGDAEIFSNSWGHDLEKIFNSLNLEVQAKLKNSFKNFTNQDLMINLAECKDYFIHSRYAHEKMSSHPYNITAIINLAKGLKHSIENW